MATLFKRLAIGLLTGMLVGPAVMAMTLAVGRGAFRLQALDLLGTAMLLGSGLSVPVGVIVAVVSSRVQYRTGRAWEWALIGASAAAFTIVVIGRMQPPAALAMLIIATGTSAAVERITALSFHDQSYDDRITGETLILYGVAIGLIVSSYVVLFRGLLLGVD